jgi:hypothetical protein
MARQADCLGYLDGASGEATGRGDQARRDPVEARQMNDQDEGVLSVEVTPSTSTVTITFEHGVMFDIDEVTAYVDDLCSGLCRHLVIYEGAALNIRMIREDGKWRHHHEAH